MPMTVTASRNRKSSHNYNSDGCGLSLTVELDQNLLRRPDELHTQIENLYAELDRAIDAESERSSGSSQPRHDDDSNRSTSHPHPNGHLDNRDRHGRRDRDHHREHDEPAMTHSQRRAITAIDKRLRLDPEDEAYNRASTSLDQLTLKQASGLIDHLKSLSPGARDSQNGNGHATSSRGAR